ncbi:MAG TPA: glycoside hydrolase family 3 C-terminal domain-containing protein, partial [Verrucomicrobiae bacterium]
ARAGAPVPPEFLWSAGQPGLQAAYFPNRDLAGPPVKVQREAQIQNNWSEAPPFAGLPPNGYSVRWTGSLVTDRAGKYQLLLTADDGCRLYLDGQRVIDHWVDSAAVTETIELELQPGKAHTLCVEYFQHGGQAVARLDWRPQAAAPYADAIATARQADVALVFATTQGTEGETSDRQTMELPGAQDELIRTVAAVNPRTIVILNNGAPVLMPWLDAVAGVLEAWYPGQEGGAALAALLFGDYNPDGKLATTFGRQREDYPDFGNFPGHFGHVDYAEGIYVGYRHFDRANINPLFPFGFGLSYTRFNYGTPTLSRAVLDPAGTVELVVPVTNTGSRAGTEIVQLYVHEQQPAIDKPVRELKGFQRIRLAPGETRPVTFAVTASALAYCDVPGRQWRADPGTYELQVGASSRDIRQVASLKLAAIYTRPIPGLAPQTAPLPVPEDLAAYHPVQCSSAASRSEYGSSGEYAVDANASTYWRPENSDEQWLAVDLAAARRFDRVRLTWAQDRFGAAFAQAYKIEVSDDRLNWCPVYATTNGTGGAETLRFTPVTARWVRLNCTHRAAGNAYKLTQLEVLAAP